MVDLIVIGLAAHRLWAVWHFGEIARRPREWVARLAGKAEGQPGHPLPAVRYVAFHFWCQFCTSISAGLVATLIWPRVAWAEVPGYALAAGVIVWGAERALVALDAVGVLPQLLKSFLMWQASSASHNGIETESR